MTVTADSPDPREYQRAARIMRGPLDQSKIAIIPSESTRNAIDRGIQRRVDKALEAYEDSSE